MKKNYDVIVMVMMIAPSPGPLSKRFGQTVDSILRRDNIEHWNQNKDNTVAEEEINAEEGTGKVIVVNVQEEDVVEETSDTVEDAVDEEADDVVIISETPGNIVIKEEPVEEIVVVEEGSNLDIEESTLIDDIEVEESNDSIEVQVEDRSDCVSEAGTFTTEEVAVVAEKIAESVVEELEDDIVYYKDVQMQYEFGEMRKENGVYFVPLRKPLLVQTPVVKLLEPISGVSTVVKVSGGFSKFVKNHEENMLRLAKENKTKWFKNDIENSALDSGFKSFLESDTLKVKISDEFAAFDTDGGFIENTFCTPAEVRCILKISGMWFGSAEFGSIMSLAQTQLARLPKCSIKPTRERKKYNYAGEFA
jgi:hypothetical protein